MLAPCLKTQLAKVELTNIYDPSYIINGQFFGNGITFRSDTSTIKHQTFSHFFLTNQVKVDLYCLYDELCLCKGWMLYVSTGHCEGTNSHGNGITKKVSIFSSNVKTMEIKKMP